MSSGVGLVFIALGEFTTSFSIGQMTDFNQMKFVFNVPQILILTVGLAWLINLLSWFIWALTEVECLKKVSKYYILSTLKFVTHLIVIN